MRARITPAQREELDMLAAELGDHVSDSAAIRWLLEQSAKRRARRATRRP